MQVVARVQFTSFWFRFLPLTLLAWFLVLMPSSALAQTTQYGFVANDNASGTDSLTIFDISTLTVVDTLTGSISDPRSVGVSRDGRYVYVSNTGTSTVSVFDVATRTEVPGSPLAAGLWPMDIAITPEGQKAYVVNYASDSISAQAARTRT